MRVRVFYVSGGRSSSGILCVVGFVGPLFRRLERFVRRCAFRSASRRVRFFGGAGPFVLDGLVCFGSMCLLRVEGPGNDGRILGRCCGGGRVTVARFYGTGLSFCRCCHSGTARLSGCCFLEKRRGCRLYRGYNVFSGSPLFSAYYSREITGVLTCSVLRVCLRRQLRRLREGRMVSGDQTSLPSGPFE